MDGAGQDATMEAEISGDGERVPVAETQTETKLSRVTKRILESRHHSTHERPADAITSPEMNWDRGPNSAVVGGQKW